VAYRQRYERPGYSERPASYVARSVFRPDFRTNSAMTQNSASACARLGEAAFAAARAEGRAMTLERAIGYALAGEAK